MVRSERSKLMNERQLVRFGAVTVILGVLEGASNQNDNLVLPGFASIALSLFHV